MTKTLLIGGAAGFSGDRTDAGEAVVETLVRLAMSHAERRVAERLPREVTALYTCGPAGGGGVRTALRERLGTVSCQVPRSLA